MKKTTRNTLSMALFSTTGVFIVAAILIGINMVADESSVRADFTEENLYTLSDGTRSILKGMDTPVTLRFYYSKSAQSMPVHLKNYARRVQDTLKEYKRIADDKIRIKRFDPKPDSEVEDSARLDGIRGQAVNMMGGRIYLGIAVHCLDTTVALPYLAPKGESRLEYELTRAIYQVSHPEKPTIGLISSLPITGNQPNPMMMRQQPQGGQPAWRVISELRKNFQIEELKAPEEIPSTIDVLLLVHATGLSEETQRAIDQFVLRGGRLLAFLDPMSVIAARDNPQGRFSQPKGSDLGALLDAWGVSYKVEKVVTDNVNQSKLAGRNGQPQDYPAFLDLSPEFISGDHPAVSQLERILIPFGGSFGMPEDAEGALEQTVLVRTSEKAGTVDAFMARMPPEQLTKNIEVAGGERALVLQLSGTFNTAFPETAEEDDGETGEEAQGESGDEAEKAEDQREPSLTSGDSTVVLVADADMLYDQFCVQQQRSVFGTAAVPVSDNLTMALNLVEMLSGDDDLISIRSRGSINRPFEVIDRKTAEAREKYQGKIDELQAELKAAEQQLRSLQQGKSEDEKFFLSPEQEKQIKRFREKRAEINRELRDQRRKLRAEIDTLENQLKWLNIAAMPAVVALLGIGFSMHRRRRTVAR